MEETQALNVECWRQEIHSLRQECLEQPAGFAERAIRKSYYLSVLRPRALRQVFQLSISEGRFEELLDDGEWGAALLEIVSNGETVLVSLASDGTYIVDLGWFPQTIKIRAHSPVLAILAAWLSVAQGGPDDTCFAPRVSPKDGEPSTRKREKLAKALRRKVA